MGIRKKVWSWDRFTGNYKQITRRVRDPLPFAYCLPSLIPIAYCPFEFNNLILLKGGTVNESNDLEWNISF